MMQQSWKSIETLANWYSSESTLWELSNEYQHDRIWIAIKNVCILVLWMKVAFALEGLNWSFIWFCICLQSSWIQNIDVNFVWKHSITQVSEGDNFQNSLRHCGLDESSLSIGRVKMKMLMPVLSYCSVKEGSGGGRGAGRAAALGEEHMLGSQRRAVSWLGTLALGSWHVPGNKLNHSIMFKANSSVLHQQNL